MERAEKREFVTSLNGVFSNTGSVVVAHYAGLTVAQMNEEAQRLQAYDTVAVNPSGLPAEGQVSSAYDLALFAREGLARPDFFEYVNTRVIEDFPGYMPEEPGDPRPTMPIATQNPLFIQGYEGAIGVKTGWTTEAGRTFVGAAVIFASALYISHREAVRRAQIRTAAAKGSPEA